MTTKGKTKLMLYLGKCANDGKPHHLRDAMAKLLLLTSKSDGVSKLQQSSSWYRGSSLYTDFVYANSVYTSSKNFAQSEELLIKSTLSEFWSNFSITDSLYAKFT